MRRRSIVASVGVVLASLACGGAGGVAPSAEAMIVDLRFTQWDCYEGGSYEGLGFKADGRCDGSSGGGWTCAYTQTGNEFVVDWTGPGGKKEAWNGVIVDPRGLEMGGTSDDGSRQNDFRCTRTL